MHASSLRQFAAAVVLAAVAGVASAQTLYTENFDDGTAASRWTTSQTGGTNLANFAYDYSAVGIPTAPGGTGSTGLRFDANTGPTGAISAIMAFPNSQNFSGNQTLSFNLWFNVAGNTVSSASITRRPPSKRRRLAAARSHRLAPAPTASTMP